jgi:hypothetical protein
LYSSIGINALFLFGFLIFIVLKYRRICRNGWIGLRGHIRRGRVHRTQSSSESEAEGLPLIERSNCRLFSIQSNNTSYDSLHSDPIPTAPISNENFVAPSTVTLSTRNQNFFFQVTKQALFHYRQIQMLN